MHHRIAQSTMTHPLDQYGVKVVNDTAYVSPEIMTVCKNLKIENLEGFLSVALSLPSAVAFQLNWPVDRVLRANEAICQSLKGIVDDEFLSPPPSVPGINC